MNYIEIKAPAKINLGLFVTSRRDDGYHNIETIFYPVDDLYDVLICRRSDHLSFTCSDPILNSPDNLVIKSVRLVEKYTSCRCNFEFTLEKNIPVGAGLGGGSSDAAAAILCLNEMLKLNLTIQQLRELALQIGSDVPFFIKPRPSIGRSRGEDLVFTDIHINLPILIVNPGIHISTKEAYSSIKPEKKDYKIEDLGNISLFNDVIKEKLVNDFEKYVFIKYPEIAEIKNTLMENGAVFSLMSGSGSTVYGFFPDVNCAEECRSLLPLQYFTFISEPQF